MDKILEGQNLTLQVGSSFSLYFFLSSSFPALLFSITLFTIFISMSLCLYASFFLAVCLSLLLSLFLPVSPLVLFLSRCLPLSLLVTFPHHVSLCPFYFCLSFSLIGLVKRKNLNSCRLRKNFQVISSIYFT